MRQDKYFPTIKSVFFSKIFGESPVFLLFDYFSKPVKNAPNSKIGVASHLRRMSSVMRENLKEYAFIINFREECVHLPDADSIFICDLKLF